MEAPQKAPLPVPTGFEQCPSSLQCPQAALEPAVPLVAASAVTSGHLGALQAGFQCHVCLEAMGLLGWPQAAPNKPERGTGWEFCTREGRFLGSPVLWTSVIFCQ